MFASKSNFFLLITTITTSIIISLAYTNASKFDITNNCSYTVWAASFPIGGGRRLDSGQTWTINVPLGSSGCRIWGRTGCTFDHSGRGRCQTGDCNGQLQCRTYGAPPTTLVEYAIQLSLNNFDFFDMSLVQGFNVPMEVSPNSSNCTLGPRCTSDITGRCPSELRTDGGCNNPCTVFKTKKYCCTGGSCAPSDYSRFFKSECPDAFSYPTDGQNTGFTCPGGTDYRVVFCPN